MRKEDSKENGAKEDRKYKEGGTENGAKRDGAMRNGEVGKGPTGGWHINTSCGVYLVCVAWSSVLVGIGWGVGSGFKCMWASRPALF